MGQIEIIEGLDLADMVEKVSARLLLTRRCHAACLVKNHLQRQEQLEKDVAETEEKLKKLKEKLAKANAKIDKIRSGDWSVLASREDGPKKGHNHGSEYDRYPHKNRHDDYS